MNILIAPDTFKGSLSAIDFCRIAEKTIKRVMPKATVRQLPMADGGEGTVDAIVTASHGEKVTVEVTAPHGEKIPATYGYIPEQELAVIEMAAASGLPLVPMAQRNPMDMTTYGTGELIKDALDKGCKKILLGIGGSATNDGGLGALSALGVKFTDALYKEVPFGGKGCLALKNIDVASLDPRLADTEIIIACDVENPLYGKNGAAYVYGPQKGATKETLPLLNEGLINLSECIKETFGRSIAELPGGGAAGGFGAGFVGILGAKLVPGFEMINAIIHVDDIVKQGDFDLIITGEGQVNHQTLQGKLPYQIGKIGKVNACPVICIAGSVAEMEEALYNEGITAVFSIVNRPMALEDAMALAPTLLEETIYNVMRLYK